MSSTALNSIKDLQSSGSLSDTNGMALIQYSIQNWRIMHMCFSGGLYIKWARVSSGAYMKIKTPNMIDGCVSWFRSPVQIIPSDTDNFQCILFFYSALTSNLRIGNCNFVIVRRASWRTSVFAELFITPTRLL